MWHLFFSKSCKMVTLDSLNLKVSVLLLGACYLKSIEFEIIWLLGLEEQTCIVDSFSKNEVILSRLKRSIEIHDLLDIHFQAGEGTTKGQINPENF